MNDITRFLLFLFFFFLFRARFELICSSLFSKCVEAIKKLLEQVEFTAEDINKVIIIVRVKLYSSTRKSRGPVFLTLSYFWMCLCIFSSSVTKRVHSRSLKGTWTKV